MNGPNGERPDATSADYKMIESAEIKNFRCFANVKVPACKRINIVVGPNGSGKTSFLEALFLASSGSVEVALRLRQIRGYDGGVSGDVVEIEDALWRDLFHNFSKKLPISITLNGTEHRNRAVTVKFNDTNQVTQHLGKRDKNLEVVSPAPITFDWVGPKGRRVIVKPEIRDSKMQLPTVIALPEETFFFGSNQNYSSLETAKRFSDISKRFQVDEITQQLRKHFPDVSGLSLEMVARTPMVCAKYRDLPEKIPLNLISSGMTKLATMLFAIASKPGGVLLVDEIENGIYYKRLGSMWDSLLDFCINNNAQVFATTHSNECIAAAAELAKNHPEHFSVIHANGKGQLRQFGGESFAEAVNQDIEIR